MSHHVSARREFLRFLAASPLAAQAWAQNPTGPYTPAYMAPASAKDALDVMDFEPLARKALPPAHWGYMATGVDDDLTLNMNREAFHHYQLRARRLVDVATVDLKTEVLGVPWDMPIYISAVGSQRAFHPQGELATARAAKAKKAMQMLSTTTSTPVEEVAKALGRPPWFQLYMPPSWSETEKLVKRVEAAGCPVLVWTIDLLGGRNTETASRLGRTDTRDCSLCHTAGVGAMSNRAMFAGIDGSIGINPPSATWEYVERLRK